MRKKKVLKKKITRTQAALEYLMTYGWALILLVVTASFLFVAGVGGFNRNSCQVNFAFLCKGVYTEGDMVILTLQNATARRIIINPFEGISFDDKMGYGTINYAGKTYRFEDVSIPSGDSFEVEGKGMVLAKKLSLTYTEIETGQTKTINISLTTDTPKTTEISNDGIDNDSDNKTDCADTGTTNCQYVMEAISAPSTITTSYQDIPFGALKGTSGNPLPGTLLKANYVALIFYVDSFTAGTKPRANLLNKESSNEAELKQGWNIVEVDTAGLTQFNGTTSQSFKLKSQGADFTVSNSPEHSPRAVFVVNKYP